MQFSSFFVIIVICIRNAVSSFPEPTGTVLLFSFRVVAEGRSFGSLDPDAVGLAHSWHLLDRVGVPEKRLLVRICLTNHA